jgi:hypothetical protein
MSTTSTPQPEAAASAGKSLVGRLRNVVVACGVTS